jgi:hypothetical protein
MINALHIFLLQNCFKGKKCDAVIKSSTFTSKVVFNLLNLQMCTCNLLSCKVCNFVDFQTCELAICKVVIIICNFLIFLIL